jgi:DNA-directed RNA polymerase specialized sigma24 family protein
VKAREGLKKDWALTESAFRLLLDWLDQGVESAGQRYNEMRRRLVRYFDRKNCVSPDELADETLNRVARRLEEQGTITDAAPAQYCYIVARFVFLESHRREQSARPAHEEPEALAVAAQSDAEAAGREQMLDCLDRCLQHLRPEDQTLILQYYHGDSGGRIEQRRALAERLGATPNALSIRACRIRDRLEDCLKNCRQGNSAGDA